MKTQKVCEKRYNDDENGRPKNNRMTRQDKRKGKQELNRMVNRGFNND